MNNYMLYVFDNFIKTTIVCSLGICLLLFLKRYVFKKFSKRFNYYIWLVIVFRMLLFLFNYTVTYEVKESKGNIVGNNITQIDIHKDNNFMLYVTYLWLIVTIVIAVYTFIKYTRFKNFVVDVSYDIEDNDVNCIYKNLLKELDIKKKIELRSSDELISPAGMGLFKSYIFLPDYPYSKDELTWILKHELMHFKNKDILIKFLVLSVKIIYWFNPLVYIMSNKVNLDCELCCDESVLADCSLKDKKEYALALIKSIKFSKNYNSKILTTEFDKTNLEKRLESIVKKKGKSGILIAVLVFMTSITSFVEVDAQVRIDEGNNGMNNNINEFLLNKTTDKIINIYYKDAPSKIRKFYEDKCKLEGKIPRDYDIIEMDMKDYNQLIK
ncbi:TPA: M56 family metallopeptidase [Clostridioides difficile]|uniref:M56 family metallopeptidase n=2 Tax=Clostridioides difficile TaxID=1496 RepID=UPI0005E9D1B1|nr:M56 family metallopeptidase [Clostridioides difficile]KJF62717.1 beta-lactamase [Clostridioides difficile]MBY1132350.1 M56 family metallopeptidase [Clostridioides difficile]MBY1883802.1 M56 family metallopeptidase [Clostridioides difficile]MBZ0781026.1 M56 family metallopeptidase [Clostridioides difficile]MBZ0854454.1 M56 family metallopeptidase [Clostridioides difficile]